MNNRSAEYTLLGFYYQFDKSIFEILNQIDDSAIITVEGTEDIDISSPTENTVMQIKYQEKTQGTNSTLRKPISLMLKHFSENEDDNLQYILYGHYEDNSKVNTTFDLDRLKKMFIYTENKISKNFLLDNMISDETIEKFLDKFKLILSTSFELHQKSTYETLKMEFNLTKDEELEIYYSNALKVVYDLSIQRQEDMRKITKKDFKEKINLKNILFNYWYIKLKSKNEYLKYIHSKYIKSHNTTNIERIFILNIASSNIEYLKDSIYEIENRFYKRTNRNISSGAPYILINNINQNDLLSLKEIIYNDDKRFSDGFYFSGSSFKCNEIRIASTTDNEISIKIINKKEYLEEILNNINGTKKVFEFYDVQNTPLSNNENYTVKIQIEELADILTIIKGR